jgi:gluconolactonase
MATNRRVPRGRRAVATLAAPRALAQAAEPRYPVRMVQLLDRAGRYRLRLAGSSRSPPACAGAKGRSGSATGASCLGDIPNNRILRWDEETGAVTIFRKPADFANGNTRDRQGRLLTCEHGKRRVSRTEYDGTITTVADKYEGKPLNSPNDIVCKSDGSIWFTDPNYGIMSDYEGHKAEMEQDGCHVYRVDPKSGKIAVVADDFAKPNGLAFSPDESILYIALGVQPQPGWPNPSGRSRSARRGLSGGKEFCRTTAGFDGFRLARTATSGRAPGRVSAASPPQRLLGRIKFRKPSRTSYSADQRIGCS